jgi:uncharacterized membrane protein (TIGR02234 family)
MTLVDPALQRSRRMRLYTIVGIGLIAALVFLTTTQNWWTLHLGTTTIPVPGTTAAPALSALALTDLALAAALAIAGPVFRLILGLLQLLLAFTVVFSTAVSLANPDQQSEALVSKATGVAGDAPIRGLIHSVTFTAWGGIAIAIGVLAFLAGIWLLLTFRAWPTASRKYQAVKFAQPNGPRDAVFDWDAMSEGADPTAEAPAADGPADGGPQR